MTGEHSGFKRMVVGLPQDLADNAAMDIAADLAERLQIEFFGAFMADATLHELAEISGARELRALDLSWQAIDLVQIARDVEHASGRARGRFAEAVKARAINAKFDVMSAVNISSLIRADDIVAIIEPAHPGEAISRQFTALFQAAFAAAGAVLIVPRRIVRASGPVLAEVSVSDDPSIAAALKIAAALRERLIVVTAAGTRLPTDLLAQAEKLGVAIEHIASSSPADALPLAAAAAPLRERLRVVPRHLLIDDALRLFSSLRGVPLLVLEPGRTNPAPD